MSTPPILRGYQRLAPDTLRIERELDAPIETVWRWLTEPALRRQWFAAGSPASSVGPLDLVFDHDELSSEDVPYPPQYAQYRGAVSHETVLKVEAPRLLVFSWDGGKEGTVTFELSPRGAKTRLVLTHTGISGAPANADFSGGWLSHLAVLEAKLGGGSVRDFWAIVAQASAAVASQGSSTS